MTISETIKMLQEAQEINGDVEIMIETGDETVSMTEQFWVIQPKGLTIDLTA